LTALPMEVVTKLNLFLLLEKEIFLRRAFVYLPWLHFL